MIIKKVDNNNLTILLNLAQAYEAEFSTITLKKPNKNGIFILDTPVDLDHPSFLLYDNDTPIGFCIKGLYDSKHDISEFYIIPIYRLKGAAYYFTTQIFMMYPGAWQVRQIEGANSATSFWRATIKKFTHDNFIEKIIDDKVWGKVTCQYFSYSPDSSNTKI